LLPFDVGDNEDAHPRASNGHRLTGGERPVAAPRGVGFQRPQSKPSPTRFTINGNEPLPGVNVAGAPSCTQGGVLALCGVRGTDNRLYVNVGP
jgi:hypothetical protein